jgi:hypothetical protein
LGNLTLEESIPKTKSSAVYQRKASSMKQADLRNMFRKASRVSAHQTMWYLLTPCLLLHQILQLRRLHKTQKRTLMTLNQQMKEISKWNMTD